MNIRPHRHEEMTDILRAVVVEELITDLTGAGGAGDDAAHHVHEHGDAGALRSADWLHHAAVERGIRIGGGTAVLIERVAERDLFPAPRGAADFSARGHC